MSLSREEIIRMAREAGFNDPDDRSEIWLGKVERFAALVAAAEREACTKLCNDADKSTHPSDLAEAIRARGDK